MLDYLGRRGTLRIGWELRAGALPFRELQRRCELSSPNLLTSRLREGVEMGVIERDEERRYGLTRSGRELLAVMQPLERWAQRWARKNAER